MRHLNLGILAAVIAACGIVGCSRGTDLVIGPRSLLLVDHRTVTTTTGAGVVVSASLHDANGSTVPIDDPQWSTRDSTVAVVVLDTAAIPGNYVSRATIVGRARTGGLTYVIVTAARLSDTVRVAVLPNKLDATLITRAGAVHPDTIVRAAQFGPPPVPAVATAFSAPDTLIINGTAALQFDTTSSYGYYGPAYVRTAAGRATGYVASRSPTRLKVVFAVGAAGPLVVRNLRLATGDSTFGTLRIDSLTFDSVAVSRQRFTGSVTVVGDTLTAAAPAGTAFSVTSCGYPSTSCVTSSPASLGLDTATTATMSLTAAQIRVLSPVSYSGPVTVRGLVVPRSDGSAFAFDSLKTNGPYTIAAATFPGAIVTGGRLLDTVTVYATANAKFDNAYGHDATVPATYPCGGCRYEVMWVFFSPDSLKFVAPVGVNGPILFGVPGTYGYGGVTVGAATMRMYSRRPLVVSGATAGEVNEPGNDSAGGATPLVPRTYVIGALNGTTDTTDYYTFQLLAPASVSLGEFSYVGTGTGDPSNPHLDAYVCDSVSGSACAAETYLLNGPVRLPAGTVWLRIALRTPAAGYVAFRMYVGANP